MKLIRVLVFFLFALLGGAAHAQRTLVPVVDFEKVPVSLSTDASLTREQVRRAFMEAGAAAGWSVVPVAEGVLEGRFSKQNKHMVAVTIVYDEKSYSVSYKDSTNMKYSEDPSAAPAIPRPNERASQAWAAKEAIRKQRELFADRPESHYLKARRHAEIHPFFEHWVYDLLQHVRLTLAATR